MGKEKIVYDPTNDRKAKKKKQPKEPSATEPETVRRSKAKGKPKPEKKPTEEDVLKVMARLEANGVAEFTSTLLRDKLKLDKESGRDIVRRVMKKLETAGKIVIEKKAFNGKRKRYAYRLKKEKA